MAIKYFTKQYAGMLPDLFAKKSAFLRAFGGVLQVKMVSLKMILLWNSK